MRLVISILIVCFILLSGCSEEENKTIEQSIVSDSDISLDNVFHTEEINEQQAISLYYTDIGYGVLQFNKQENSWEYQQALSAGHPEPEHPMSTNFVYKDNYSVSIGEIFDPEISKVIVKYNNNERDATIVEVDKRMFWYSVSKEGGEDILKSHISGYAEDGKLIYQSSY
ncbi:MAG: hypothetical protein ACK4M9_03825 [Anaerobacillus sp.]|uniref:hypothetical protein n=1 Tax=Anaerobacillus sp. TaxID=1872506 RepID=UPI00391CD40B